MAVALLARNPSALECAHLRDEVPRYSDEGDLLPAMTRLTLLDAVVQIDVCLRCKDRMQEVSDEFVAGGVTLEEAMSALRDAGLPDEFLTRVMEASQ